MHNVVWNLDGNDARLYMRGVSAAVDISRPNLGLHELVLDERELDDMDVLGVDLSLDDSGPAVELVEAYCRGHDLIATYATAENAPRRAQLYWRALSTGAPTAELAIELWVSVQTAALDDAVAVRVSTRLAAAAALRLVDPRSARFESIDEPEGDTVELAPSEGPGCFIIRPSDSDISYLEMIHQADFRRSRLLSGNTGGPALQLQHDLFAERLEKGVILRARLRGLLIPRADDTERATAGYQELIEEEPPLET